MSLKIQIIVNRGIKLNKKLKLLVISDHAKTNTGVAVQSNHLISGLIKTKKYKVVQLGAAVYHDDYSTDDVEEDFTIIPVNGFGDKDTIRSMLVSYVPDAIIIFSDSRFFGHVFEMEDEIHQICPILWWHVWDNRPVPLFNKPFYDCVDTINCISEITYDMCKEVVKEDKINYIPHSLPDDIFYSLSKEEVEHHRAMIFGKNKDDFVCSWFNRNIRRKRPADVLKSWQVFLMMLEQKYKHKKAILLMHTDPYDRQGMNLLEIAKNLNVLENVRFSDQEVGFDKINMLHNISDIHINIAHTEGFGLSTLEAMSVGKPIIGTQTGGLVRQLINPTNFFVHGVALKPTITTISGTQSIPYLNEDYVSIESASNAIMSMYELGAKERNKLGEICKTYVKENFAYEEMISKWDMSLAKTIKEWKKSYQRVRIEEIN